VHGFGLRHHLIVIGIDRQGRVGVVRDLAPRRMMMLSGATWVAELPLGWVPPPPGALLELEPVAWPDATRTRLLS
jgi:hypothetical protein